MTTRDPALNELELREAVRRISTVIEFLERIRQGDDDETVWNGNQDLPTVAKVLKDGADQIGSLQPLVAASTLAAALSGAMNFVKADTDAAQAAINDYSAGDTVLVLFDSTFRVPAVYEFDGTNLTLVGPMGAPLVYETKPQALAAAALLPDGWPVDVLLDASRDGGRNSYLTQGSDLVLNPLRMGGKYPALATVSRATGGNYATLASDGESIVGIDVDMARADHGDGHGVVMPGSDQRASDLSIRDFGSADAVAGSGVLMFGAPHRERLVLSDCVLIGSTDAVVSESYGWIGEDIAISMVHGVIVQNAKTYAHELKNDSRFVMLSSLVAAESGIALAYGQDTQNGSDCNVLSGLVARACDGALTVGYGSNNLFSGVLLDTDNSPGSAGTKHFARFEQSSGNAVFGGLARGSTNNLVRYSIGSHRNYVQVAAHDTSSTLVVLQTGVTGNATEICHPGTRNSIQSGGLIADSSGSGMRGSQANPIWCNATGERLGSISGRFHDKLGNSGATLNASHYWVSESDGSIVHALAGPGNAGDSAGIAYSIPGNAIHAGMLYLKAVASAAEYWRWVVAGAVKLRLYLSTLRPETDDDLNLGAATQRFKDTYSKNFRPGAGGPVWTSGVGSPEGVVTAPVGSMYTRTDGAAGSTLYVKESGTEGTGWVSK